jgi:site-specific DNA-cytosine methylase
LLASSSGESQACIFADILARSPVAAEHHARAIAAGRMNYAAVWGALRADGLLLDTAGYCSRHGRSCQLPRPALDVSGSPCTPWSSVGHRGGRASPVTCLFLTWCQWARHVQPLVLIHENVVGWDPTTIDECLGDLYDCVTLRTAPADAGFPFIPGSLNGGSVIGGSWIFRFR